MTKPNKGGAPKNNRNAARGKRNRVTLAVMVTPETRRRIDALAAELGISRGQIIDRWATSAADEAGKE
jgi:hypothetical protein